jgi:hypothetical protein
VRAKELLDKQLAAVKAGDNNALRAMFAPNAELLLPDASVVEPSLDLVSRIAVLNPHASLVSAKVNNLAAGGTADAVWLDAELEIVLTSSEEGHKAHTITHAVRMVELLDGASGWKIAAASIALPQPATRKSATFGELPAATDQGPLSKLLASPGTAAGSLGTDPSVFVLGTELAERAIGPDAAKQLLGKWSKLTFAIEEKDKVHEIRNAKWGYAMANINLVKGKDDPYRMTGLVIGVPTSSGSWSVVAVVYDAI